MFKEIKHFIPDNEIRGRDNHCLLIISEDRDLTLPPVERSRGHLVHLLPIEGAKITLLVPDSKTMISTPSGDMDSVTITGQNIVSLYSHDKWYVAGMIATKRTKRQPETALT